MTKQEFFNVLAQIKDRFEWRIERNGCIRGLQGNFKHCPITAVYCEVQKKRVSTTVAGLAGGELGLDACTIDAIIRGADGERARYRKALLKAVGLG